jgi:hypothetical protein
MIHDRDQDAESLRLAEDSRREKNWKRWGPYLAERQWGTVREDYSANGDAWNYFPHEHARSRAYRWGEDGLLGITDRECRLCCSLALWNGRDPILKERLFGLANGEGNHGEDVKECYYYLDATPTSSYLKALYKYPQAAFPYDWLLNENRRRGKREPEFELADTGIFDENRYFDVFVEYAKAGPNDILVRITAHNRGPHPAVLHLLPTLWFRNTWSWGFMHEGYWSKPSLRRESADTIAANHDTLKCCRLHCGLGSDGRTPLLLFTENESNFQRLFGMANAGPFVKDAFHEYLIQGKTDAANPAGEGTKAAAYYVEQVPAGGQVTIRLRLLGEDATSAAPFGGDFDLTFMQRIQEADEFYAQRVDSRLSAEERQVARQAYAGLLWSKQFYKFVVKDWLRGDPASPPPPASRLNGRNSDWPTLYNRDVISMPDKWEYPWYAAWDLAFHLVAFAEIDPQFAKDQLLLFLREWYMHPNGQIPAYEWNFSDVNPPVHAWACWRVYKMTGQRGERDRLFLARVFQKLLINFTWWVNRKDVAGKNLFAGGFLGMDNIGPFDRSIPPPPDVLTAQADGTAWMAFYCLTMLGIALELASEEPEYEDIASKFFEHFVAIVDAMHMIAGTGLWNEQDGFYYDGVKIGDHAYHLKTRSMVGLIPLFAVVVLDEHVIGHLPGFKKRLDWFLKNRDDLGRQITYCEHQVCDGHDRLLLAIPSKQRLERVLRYLLDEEEFLSPYGIRALSRFHLHQPYVVRSRFGELRVDYDPGDSTSNLFGGNSNWRGPIWFPVNYLLVEALQRYHYYFGDDFKVECPTGSGRMLNLREVAAEIAARLGRIFLPDAQGRRPCHGNDPRYATDPHWRDLLLFYEYFHGDDGRGLGASHQTGWTALVVRLMERFRNTSPDRQGGVAVKSAMGQDGVKKIPSLTVGAS